VEAFGGMEVEEEEENEMKFKSQWR